LGDEIVFGLELKLEVLVLGSGDDVFGVATEEKLQRLFSFTLLIFLDYFFIISVTVCP
jgi:hypothetical protein